MSALVLKRALRWPSLRAFGAALVRSQRLAVASSASYRNQCAACPSAPVRFAPERTPRGRWLA